MSDFTALERQIDAARNALSARIGRLYEGLHHLASVTMALREATNASPTEIAQWIADAGFEVDEHGYFERRDVLAAARRRSRGVGAARGRF